MAQIDLEELTVSGAPLQGELIAAQLRSLGYRVELLGAGADGVRPDLRAALGCRLLVRRDDAYAIQALLTEWDATSDS